MGDLGAIIGLLKSAPAEITTALTILTVLVTLILSIRKTNIDSVTSVSNMQQSNIKILMQQNKQLLDQNGKLSVDLEMLRDRMASLYSKIDELEDLVRSYKNRCDTCPGAQGEINSTLIPDFGPSKI